MAWLFQTNPNDNRVDDMIRHLNGVDTVKECFFWIVRENAKQIQMGDRVVLWRAAGDRQEPRGAYGYGRVVTSPARGDVSDALSSYWITPPEADAFHAKLSLDRVLPVGRTALIKELEGRPAMRGWSMFAGPYEGTNFALADEFADEICSLIDEHWSLHLQYGTKPPNRR